MAAGALATVWVSGPAASAVGAGLAVAVFGVTSERAKALLNKRAEQRETLPRHVLAAGASGRPRRVRELDDPIALGVHPAEAITRAVDGRTVVDRVPPYVPRDDQHRLRELADAGGFVLLVGDSTAGKTRAAYEAMRALLPDHALIVPAGRTSFTAIVPAVQAERRCVVWLDDLERFLGAGGLTSNTINRLLDSEGGRDTLVLATMRSREHDRYSAREEPEFHGPERDSWRDARSVLELATVVELRRGWSDEELRRARAYADDPRIRSALPKAGPLGLAELLATGPQLTRDWRNAWRPGAHPRGAALVAAAVDCRRAGLHEPQALETLAELSEHYLAAAGGALLRPEPLDDALTWATAPSQGASSLLLPNDDGRFLAFDYLIDVAGLDRIPQATWDALVARATPAQAFDLGQAAEQRMLYPTAASAYRNAAGIADAEVALAWAISNSGEPLSALREVDELLALRRATYDPSDRRILRIRWAQAYCQMLAGYFTLATAAFAQLADDQSRLLGRDDPEALETRREHAVALANMGDFPQATQILEEIIERQQTVLGPSHPSTLISQGYLTQLLSECGDFERALKISTELCAAWERVSGPDSPWTLRGRGGLALATFRAGNPARAAELLHELARDRERVLGTEHSHVLLDKCWLVVFESMAGNKDQATDLLAKLIADRRSSLGESSSYAVLAADLITLIASGGRPSGTGMRQRLSDFLRACASVLGTQHPFVSALRHSLGELLPD
ncbi:tetratricopeptide repeat protein [Solihabitans fulvus]|uniref:Tetratricopeptide repeat protein n=1 Tax=Solihabitans fulvus TaxID=1892852 RepID=A0A5B2XQE0_9PSEU|nr:tetratricopeptide repeat protein [Solihabitans fulvus]KAA2265092.1 tetratricopeptide repeat protein [Solihabitans fulvus]